MTERTSGTKPQAMNGRGPRQIETEVGGGGLLCMSGKQTVQGHLYPSRYWSSAEIYFSQRIATSNLAQL